MEKFDYGITSVFALWICYQAQSLISINQIGVAIWGWATTGLVLGYTRSHGNDKNWPNKTKNRNSKKEMWPAIFGLILGLAIGSPTLLTDANFRSAYTGSSADKLIKAASKYPEDYTRTLVASEALAKSNLMEQSNLLLNHILEKNPRFYGAWQLRYQISAPNSEEQIRAKSMLSRLNPQVKIK